MARGQLPRRPYKGIIFTQASLSTYTTTTGLTRVRHVVAPHSSHIVLLTRPLGQLADRFEQLPTPNSPKKRAWGVEEKSVRKRGVQAFEGEESFENGHTREERDGCRQGWLGWGLCACIAEHWICSKVKYDERGGSSHVRRTTRRYVTSGQLLPTHQRGPTLDYRDINGHPIFQDTHIKEFCRSCRLRQPQQFVEGKPQHMHTYLPR